MKIYRIVLLSQQETHFPITMRTLLRWKRSGVSSNHSKLAPTQEISMHAWMRTLRSSRILVRCVRSICTKLWVSWKQLCHKGMSACLVSLVLPGSARKVPAFNYLLISVWSRIIAIVLLLQKKEQTGVYSGRTYWELSRQEVWSRRWVS